MDKVRADEGRKLRQETSTRQGGNHLCQAHPSVIVHTPSISFALLLAAWSRKSIHLTLLGPRAFHLIDHTDDKKNARFAEEARKARLQLVRARKDLRELWLERDELAMLAGQAIKVG